jgi:VWFA-related protein
MSRKFLLLTLLCGSLVFLLMAQQPAAKQAAPAKQPPQDLLETNPIPNYKVTLQQVVAPVLVYDKKHNYVNGLQQDQFRLFDNEKEQNLTSVDVTYTPISMVVAVQANAEADKILPKVNGIGAMLEPIILGDQGEAAVIAYDHRVRLLQPFTSDTDDITKAIKGIHAGSTSSRLIDAVEQSVYLLRNKPKQRRRVLLVIGEGRDGGSQARPRETLENLQLANIAVYFVDMSHIIGKLTTPPPDPRPAAQPPAAMGPLGGGHPSTPTTEDQTFGTDGYSADAFPLMVEIFRDVKNIFKVSTATLFTKGTGGEQFPFATSHGLEEAISAIGDELHSQYIITYTPNNTGEGGFHKIEVEVVGRQYKCETKPGYFMSPIFH